jgi:hypothetical protein
MFFLLPTSTEPITYLNPMDSSKGQFPRTTPPSLACSHFRGKPGVRKSNAFDVKVDDSASTDTQSAIASIDFN